jgi:hypothetical protein
MDLTQIRGGRDVAEYLAHKAWVELGNPAPNQGKPQNLNDLQYDAFRHAYQSAVVTRRAGEDVARAAGDHIERTNGNNWNRGEVGQRDMRGDLINNEKGREIGKNSPEGASDRQIAERVADAVKNGDLIIDKQTDQRTLPENFPRDLEPTKRLEDVPPDRLDRFLDQLEKDILDGLLDLSKNLSDLGKNIKDWWDRAKNWVWPRDPIILDLDGDGLETVGLASNIHFDHDGDGVLTRTGWVGKNDALLVWDRNANGTIDTGAELFGDFTPLPNGTLAPNGFAALAALDANGDGVIDASDPAFAELKLWRDADQNGATGTGELISLLDAGIVSLNLAHALKNQRLANGNTLSREGSFTRTDGSTSAMGEFHLAVDTFDTRFANEIEVPEELKTLPNMGGAGNVRELQQAAAQSGSVAGLVNQFQSATTRAEQKALLDRLLTAWAGTSGMAGTIEERAAGRHYIEYIAIGNARGSANVRRNEWGMMDTGGQMLPMVGGGNSRVVVTFHADSPAITESYRALIAAWSRTLHVLEAFNGQYFFNLPTQKSQTASANWGMSVARSSGGDGGGGGSMVGDLPEMMGLLRIQFSPAQLDLLQQAYDSLKESVYASLVMQTRLKPYLDQIELVIDDSGLRLDATALNQMLAAKKASDPENHLADRTDLVLTSEDKSRRWRDGTCANDKTWRAAA